MEKTANVEKEKDEAKEEAQLVAVVAACSLLVPTAIEETAVKAHLSELAKEPKKNASAWGPKLFPIPHFSFPFFS